jgi:GNAT superfamily N-acetyltransferase
MDPGWWQALVPADGSRRLAGVRSNAYPDGTRVELDTERYAHFEADVVCVATYGADATVVGLDVPTHRVPKAPPLWWVEVRDTTDRPPAVNLIAFTGHGQRTGVLFDEAAASNLGAATSDQVGALRWYPVSGLIDQIFVAPEWRRRGIATALLHAAAILSAARDWPRIWADGQRTVLGDEFRNGGDWKLRGAELTHVSPPMDPAAQDRQGISG